MQWLVQSWYRRHPVRWLLWPLSKLYCVGVSLRRWAYRWHLFKSTTLPVPVIVVGNLTVGGTGKTPFVIWLAQQLIQAGYTPGIISRGYGGKARHYPQAVTPDSQPELVGDEPVLMAQRTQCPVVVAPQRHLAGEYLLKMNDCNIIIADDGLQHYALHRDIEIAVIDSQRQLGNMLCLPAGPLREPPSRLSEVDFIVYNGACTGAKYTMELVLESAINLARPEQVVALTDFRHQPVHAVAAIGHPERFFHHLTQAGLNVIPHPFPDHYHFNIDNLHFDDDYPVFMTEKDAVKCYRFANEKFWCVPVSATLTRGILDAIIQQLSGYSHG